MYIESFYFHNKSIPYYHSDYYSEPSIVFVLIEYINKYKDNYIATSFYAISDHTGADIHDRIHFWPSVELNASQKPLFTWSFNLLFITTIITPPQGDGEHEYDPPLGNPAPYYLCLGDFYYKHYMCVSYTNSCTCLIRIVKYDYNSIFIPCENKISITIKRAETYDYTFEYIINIKDLDGNLIETYVLSTDNDEIVYEYNVPETILLNLEQVVIEVMIYYNNNIHDIYTNTLTLSYINITSVSTNYSGTVISTVSNSSIVSYQVYILENPSGPLLYSVSGIGSLPPQIVVPFPIMLDSFYVRIHYRFDNSSYAFICQFQVNNSFVGECYSIIYHRCTKIDDYCSQVLSCDMIQVIPPWVVYAIQNNIPYTYNLQITSQTNSDYCYATEQNVYFENYQDIIKIKNDVTYTISYQYNINNNMISKQCQKNLKIIGKDIYTIVNYHHKNKIKYRVKITSNNNNIRFIEIDNAVITISSDDTVNHPSNSINDQAWLLNEWEFGIKIYTIDIIQFSTSALTEDVYFFECVYDINIFEDIEIINDPCEGQIVINIPPNLPTTNFHVSLYYNDNFDVSPPLHYNTQPSNLSYSLDVKNINGNPIFISFDVMYDENIRDCSYPHFVYLFYYYYFVIESVYVDAVSTINFVMGGFSGGVNISVTYTNINNNVVIDSFSNINNSSVINLSSVVHPDYNTISYTVTGNTIDNRNVSFECTKEVIYITPQYNFTTSYEYNICYGLLLITIERTPNGGATMTYSIKLYDSNNNLIDELSPIISSNNTVSAPVFLYNYYQTTNELQYIVSVDAFFNNTQVFSDTHAVSHTHWEIDIQNDSVSFTVLNYSGSYTLKIYDTDLQEIYTQNRTGDSNNYSVSVNNPGSACIIFDDQECCEFG